MRALSTKPTAPMATAGAPAGGGPRGSATGPTGKAATPPSTRLIDSTTDTAPRLQPKASESTGRKTPNVDTAVAMHEVTVKSATTTRQRGASMPVHRTISVMAKPYVLEFGMGVDVHGADATTAAKRAVSDAIRHSSLPFFADVRARAGRMLVDVTVGVPDPKAVDVEAVKRELPHGEVTVRAVGGRARRPVGDTLIACVAITVSIHG